MPVPTPRERLGTLLANKYTIDRIVAVGGMGVLYAGRDPTGAEVAIKLLKPHDAADEDKSSRFVREAVLGASLRHPHVVAVLDAGRDADGSDYLVMELLRGVSLQDELKATGALGPDATLRLLLPIMGALAMAHRQGIVHRDVKPANVFLAMTEGGLVPKLLDFGIAKADDSSLATRSGSMLGTPGYMSPEQVNGQAATPASDVWALGVTLYHCMAGRRPFAGQGVPQVLYEIVHGRIEPLDTVAPTVGVRLASAVQRALSRDPAVRYPDVETLAHGLLLAATADGIELPDDPDPVGLPAWRSWLEQANEAEATARHDVGAATVAPSTVGDTRIAPSIPEASTGRQRHALRMAVAAGLVAGLGLLARFYGEDDNHALQAVHATAAGATNDHAAITAAPDMVLPSPKRQSALSGPTAIKRSAEAPKRAASTGVAPPTADSPEQAAAQPSPPAHLASRRIEKRTPVSKRHPTKAAYAADDDVAEPDAEPADSTPPTATAAPEAMAEPTPPAEGHGDELRQVGLVPW